MLGLVGQLRELLNSRAMDVSVVDANGDQLTTFPVSVDNTPDVVVTNNVDVTVTNTPLPVSFTATPPPTAVLTNVTVDSTVGGTQLLAANVNRRKFHIWNATGTQIFVAFDGTASATVFTVLIPNGGNYESELNDYTGQIKAFKAAGSGTVRVTEITT